MTIIEMEALAKLMRDYSLTEAEVEQENFKLRFIRDTEQKACSEGKLFMAQASSQEGATSVPDQSKLIKAPMVGVFYNAPGPEAAPFVKQGDRVKKGDVLCIIEAMKLMNEIVCEQDCEILNICINNGDIVEYGQALFEIS